MHRFALTAWMPARAASVRLESAPLLVQQRHSQILLPLGLLLEAPWVVLVSGSAVLRAGQVQN